MTCEIHGIGTAVPPYRLTQDQALAIARTLCMAGEGRPAALAAVYRRSGIRYRHSVLVRPGPGGSVEQSFYPAAAHSYDSGPTTGQRMERYEAEVGPLALAASTRALDDACMDGGAITHLVTVSCTGFAAPGFDQQLMNGLGIDRAVARTHVGFMGCHAVMNALRVGAAYADADADARILVSSVELCSLHQQYGWHPERIVANALFADGAASVVLSRRGLAFRKSRGAPRLLSNASMMLPGSDDVMAWRIGDHGFQMRLSANVPNIVRRGLRPWLSGWLRTTGLAIEDIGGWAIHPGGPRVLSACAEVLELGQEALAPSRGVLEEFGNMSSPTVLFILDRLRSAGAPRPWVTLGFGPGLAAEAMLIG